MIDNIRKALSPVLFSARLYGLAVFEHPSGHLRPLISSIYISIVWTIYGSIIYYLFSLFPPSQSVEEKLGEGLKTVDFCSAVLSGILAVLFRKRLQGCLDSLQIVDDTLEDLGIPKEYPKLFKASFAAITAWFILYFTCLLQYAKYSIQYYNCIVAVVLPHLVHYPLYVNTTTEIMFWTLLWYTGNRFSQINKCLGKLGDNKKYVKTWSRGIASLTPVSRSSADIEKCKHTIRVLMQMHLELCRISHVINGLFEVQVCLQMSCYFALIIMILGYLFQMILFLKEGRSISVAELLSLSTWGGMHVAKIFITNCLCEYVRGEANKARDIINKLLNTVTDKEVREDGIQFTFQVLQKPLRFTGLGLFDLGYHFIKKFFSFQSTVLVIILQMAHSSKLRNSADYWSPNNTDS